MTTSIRLGKIAGVDIGINWSWLVVAVLVVWVLAAGVFPDSNPGLSDGTYLAMAVIAAALFFASLLLHELGHAIQARREGMELEGITLWIFGGVARFKGTFPSAGAEFRIAVAGPLVSLAIGASLVLVAALTPLPSAPDGVVYWLGTINLVLLAFNLLPALPLDGGRVLRAALWARRGDFQAATRSAAGLGRFFGQFLIAWGLVVAILGGSIGGLWLAFIGWFLLMAAESEAAVAAAQAALEGVTVGDAMVRDPVTVGPDLSLDRFMDQVFFPHRHTAYPVTEQGRAVGLLSFRAVARTSRVLWSRRQVREAMVPLEQALVVSPRAKLSEVLGDLIAREPRRALVCEEGRLTGLLSVTDAVRILEARGGRAPVPAQ